MLAARGSIWRAAATCCPFFARARCGPPLRSLPPSHHALFDGLAGLLACLCAGLAAPRQPDACDEAELPPPARLARRPGAGGALGVGACGGVGSYDAEDLVSAPFKREALLATGVLCVSSTFFVLTANLDTLLLGASPSVATPAVASVVWLALTSVRVPALLDAFELEGRELSATYSRLLVCLATSAIGMLVLTIACSSARGAVGVALSWCGVALYALGNGPSLGYCFALLARLTEPSAAGMTIVSSAKQ